MKKFMFIIGSFLSCFTTRGQKPLQVMDWKTGYTVNASLLQEMHAQYDARRTRFAHALGSKASMLAYGKEVQQKFKKLLGSLPQRSPLKPKITGTITKNGYRIEKVHYESFPGHHVTANLYLPQGKGKFPAALLFCGHEPESKATESYQRTAILFVKNGFAVLVVDPVSQGERHQLMEAGKPLTRGGTTEHTLLNGMANLLGTSLPAYELWDNVRSLDYLVSRPEIDTSRIGCLGNSGGAIQTIYFAAYEQRIKVFAPCSYLATRERTLELTGPADGCAQVPGEGKEGLEMADYLIAAAPKPVLVLAGRYDFIDYEGTMQACRELEKVYKVLEQPQKFAQFTYDDGHGISKPKREAAVTWFRRWLYNDAKPVVENSWNDVLTEKELFVTQEGQVHHAFEKEQSILDRLIFIADSLEKSRRLFLQQNKEDLNRAIRDLLQLPVESTEIVIQDLDSITRNSLTFYKLVLRRRGHVPLPVLMVRPGTREQNKRIMIWMDGDKSKLVDSTEKLEDLLKRGYVVFLPDLQGSGETTDRAEFNDPKYYNREYRNAMVALHNGRSMVSRRTADIINLLDFVSQMVSIRYLPVEVDAGGIAAIPALHAAVLDNRITSISTTLPFSGFRNRLLQPAVKDLYSDIIPGVLQYYDLPDLIMMLKNRWKN